MDWDERMEVRGKKRESGKRERPLERCDKKARMEGGNPAGYLEDEGAGRRSWESGRSFEDEGRGRRWEDERRSWKDDRRGWSHLEDEGRGRRLENEGRGRRLEDEGRGRRLEDEGRGRRLEDEWRGRRKQDKGEDEGRGRRRLEGERRRLEDEGRSLQDEGRGRSWEGEYRGRGNLQVEGRGRRTLEDGRGSGWDKGTGHQERKGRDWEERRRLRDDGMTGSEDAGRQGRSGQGDGVGRWKHMCDVGTASDLRQDGGKRHYREDEREDDRRWMESEREGGTWKDGGRGGEGRGWEGERRGGDGRCSEGGKEGKRWREGERGREDRREDRRRRVCREEEEGKRWKGRGKRGEDGRCRVDGRRTGKLEEPHVSGGESGVKAVLTAPLPVWYYESENEKVSGRPFVGELLFQYCMILRLCGGRR
jgi:hypothetical protein